MVVLVCANFSLATASVIRIEAKKRWALSDSIEHLTPSFEASIVFLYGEKGIADTHGGEVMSL